MKLSPAIDERFHRLVVLRETRLGRTRALECRCDCGTVKVVNLIHVVRGNVRSCGCLSRESRADVLARRRASAPTLVERFWSKVDKAGECWLWQGHRSPRGYGAFAVKLPDGRWWTVRASRMAWELTNGKIPADQIVCHHCDNPPCVRPDHLFLGTHADNAADRETKGRGVRLNGEAITSSKLTAAQVAIVRQWIASGASQCAVAEHFGVGQPTIHAIVTGRTWRHIQAPTSSVNCPDSVRPRIARGEAAGSAVLTTEAVRTIRAAVAGGETRKDVARRYGVSRSLVSMIVARRRWSHVA